MSKSAKTPLDDLRGSIDAIDTELTHLISARMSVAGAIGERKVKLDLPVHALKREEVLLKRIAGEAAPNARGVLRSTYEVLIAGSRRFQLAMRELRPMPSGTLRAVLDTPEDSTLEERTDKILAAFLSAGVSLLSLERKTAPGEKPRVEMTFRSFGTEADAVFAADLEGLGARVAPEKTLPEASPGAQLRCGLLGEHLGHTLSPEIHAHFADYSYEAFEVPREGLEAFFASGAFDGLNVTIPYKEAVMGFCRRLSARARRIGAVNTIVREADGSLTGHNTDYAGFRSMVEHSGIDADGKTALVLGSGGASKCACAVLRDLGARPVVVSRRGPVTYGNLEGFADTRILVNTTPVGMFPKNGETPIDDLTVFPNLEGVFDVIYNPAKTALMLEAEALGIPAFGGLKMLVVQAAEAARLFLHGGAVSEVPEKVEDLMRIDRENIVLTGMPGSGKTTVGRLLARRLRRDFVDLDAEIVRRTGRAIPDIFREEGEARFREIEEKVCADVCSRLGVVIATGGGTMMREANRRACRQNGRVVLLMRPFRDLPTAGRPVSQSRTMESLWAERGPVYEAVADITVQNTRPGVAVEAIVEALRETAPA